MTSKKEQRGEEDWACPLLAKHVQVPQEAANMEEEGISTKSYKVYLKHFAPRIVFHLPPLVGVLTGIKKRLQHTSDAAPRQDSSVDCVLSFADVTVLLCVVDRKYPKDVETGL